MQTTTNAFSTTVRANVNERAFFKSMKHLFASSFSVMGEMVQNARRAQASKIAITCDSATRVITISDDGMGIHKFEVLLDLATSGWESTETQLSERPFGMGFFSSCYAAERVVVMSKGQRLEISQEDVIEQRALQVVPMTAEQQATMGGWTTRIELHGVIEELLQKTEASRPAVDVFRQRLSDLVKGFPLPIGFNGDDLSREKSKEAIKSLGVQTAVGFVAIRSVSGADGLVDGLQLPCTSNMRLYLQGLPIEEGDRYRGSNIEYIVHLDSSRFIAQMPDRKHLFDSERQIAVIQEALTELVRNRLVQKKATLEAQAFVHECWALAKAFNMHHLFNDVPFIPSSIVSSVCCVARSTDYQDVLASNHRVVEGQEKLISHAEIKSGGLVAWLDAPGCTTDDPWAATALRVMQLANIHDIATNRLPEGHWLHDLCTNYSDLVFQVEVEGAGDKEVDFCWHSSTATIRAATSAKVIVTSTVDPGFRLEQQVGTDWLMVPVVNPEESTEEFYGYEDQDYICWLLDGESHCTDHPVNVLATFTNDSDLYVEEWETDAKNAWDNKLAVLRDHHLSSTVARILGREYPQYSESNLGQLALVRLRKYSALGAVEPSKYNDARAESLEVDEDMLTRICARLLSNAGVTVSAEQLGEALWHAVRPGELIGGELQGSYHRNATLVKAQAD